MAEETVQPQQFPIKADDAVLKGQYATMANVAHSSEEFLIDFMNGFPPAGQYLSRIIFSPSHFKRLVRAMEQNFKNYEDQYGVIQLQIVPDRNVKFDSTNGSNHQ